MIASFLLFDGRQHEVPLVMMNEEGAFPRLLELLQVQALRMDDDSAAGLHRLLMDLLYELSRIQKIRIEDLILVDDDFVRGLFDIIEHLSYDANDPYHYPVIRVLLVLNEQFMISAHNPDEGSPSAPLTNKVIKVLSMHGNSYKTFAETSLQLLTLKLLYLIFTTPSTYEYFFTNDLHVLVDILIRNLLDLPEEASALRHTYLRVLYPLIAHTQLRLPPHYKRDELKRMLSLLVRGQLTGDTAADCEKIMHFDEVDETTRRLVLRCAAVDWLRDEPEPYKLARPPQREDSLTLSFPSIDGALLSDADIGTSLESSQSIGSNSTRGSSLEDLTSPPGDGRDSPASAGETPRKHSHVERLEMYLAPASSSSLSVDEIASQREKPGVITPSRHDGHLPGAQTSPTKHKVKPLPPKTRRWRGRRATVDETASPLSTASIAEERGNASSPSPLSSTPLVTASEQFFPNSERRDSSSTIHSHTHMSSAHQEPVHLHPPPAKGPSTTRRSASNPPPAVPPPRRSAVHHNLHPSSSSHCTPATSLNPSPSRPAISAQSCTTTVAAQSHKQAQKPEPPRTRRWGRKHTFTDSSDTSQASQAGNSISSSVSSGSGSVATAFLHPDYPYSLENTSSPAPTPASTTVLGNGPAIEAAAAAAVATDIVQREDPKTTEAEPGVNGDGHEIISVEKAVQNVSLQ
ncbi:uncharacterized protein DSM5745_01353 [Aspergillus mulundensis]|uniref:SPIN90/Ldb17 leucine-rich domain-containing protein n=1 Tax=Aspergillus mulundensis TaxID=1810919 RepID=A0A3D8T6H3_9EURO|nr:Uncharacterized protein DSM5745_01353 [Aspergillus mulundensis]RDW94031.1 Uncharacterized protein DSM5745_01353 [Aspergillus mulundensis]